MPVLPAVASISVAPGRRTPRALGVVDDGERDAILDAAAGVQVLALDEHRDGGAPRERAKRHERRVADVIEDRGRGHAGRLSGGARPVIDRCGEGLEANAHVLVKRRRRDRVPVRSVGEPIQLRPVRVRRGNAGRSRAAASRRRAEGDPSV